MKRTVIILLVVLVAAFGGLYLYLDRIVETVIERSSTEATGVETDVEAVTLNLWTGALRMSMYTIQNPPDSFESPFFLSMDEGQVEVPVTSLWRDTVEVPQVALDSLTFNLEQRGTNANYRVILNNLNEYITAEEPEPGPTMLVDDMVIRNTTVNLLVVPDVADLPPIADLQVTIPTLRMQNLGGEEGVSVADLTMVVITTVLQTILESEVDLPGAVRELLRAQLGDLPDVPVQVEGEIEVTGAEDLKERAEEAVEQGKDILDRARDIFGGDTSENDAQ